MKKGAFLAIMCMFFANISFAQSDEETAIKQRVNNLFTGMKTCDSTLASSAFAKGSILQTIVNKEGKTIVKTESVSAFLKMIATPRNQKYDERIVFSKILIDGPLASVWTDYKFYIGENHQEQSINKNKKNAIDSSITDKRQTEIQWKFSHCGVNSFQLVKGDNGWQIAYLIDTRRKENCKP
ncbi:hypothetical protein QWY86_13775 [Pedobacter aquatilis]|uniref:hypothetical protein n=1 Tax=Pedobacter aquatilis TaxID=351343 RepID=UPI0025B60058|nr:hypothetical protein [Pedobacter aquatilis]MDN3587746.1 hypothetical protein [Pedobacter aquatilis]